MSLRWFKETRWSGLILPGILGWLPSIFFFTGLALVATATVLIVWSTFRPLIMGVFYRWRFPRSKLGLGFTVVGKKEPGHKVWLLEKTKRWIGNTATFHGLHFYWDDIKDLPSNIDTYTEIGTIVIDGSPGVEPSSTSIER